MFKVTITPKGTSINLTLADGLTRQEAESICESWGWMYDDGKRSYYMGLEEM